MMTSLESLVGKMTVAELAARANLPVARLVEVAFAGRPASTSKSTTPKRTANGDVARGGLSLDQVLAAVASVGAPAKMEDVRATVGGTVLQVRAALQKLAGAKKIVITGRRRGTRYAAR